MVEQLPFKQLVWSSSLQRPTKKNREFQNLRFFYFAGTNFCGNAVAKLKLALCFFDILLSFS